MTMQMVGAVHRRVAVEVVSAEQDTTDSYVAVEDSEIDARPWKSLAYTIKVSDQNSNWKVLGANKADYSDEVEVKSEETVNAGGASSYAVSQAPYAYYRVKIQESVSGGKAEINGIAKG